MQGHEQRLIDWLPRDRGSTGRGLRPLARAFNEGLTAPASVTTGATIAEGIAIGSPARGHQILAAVRETGKIVTVTDDQIRAAYKALARAGLHVEPTAAASGPR
jgi:threonine synthase